MFSLEAKIRVETARETRESGLLPAVVYGKDVPSTSLSLGVSDFIRTYRQSGQNHIIALTVDGKTHHVLVHEAQRHPVSGAFLHIDFLVVNMKADITVEVPLNFVGTAPAVIAGAQLLHTLHSVTVRCLPSDMIESIDLDISTLEHPGQSLHISDLVIDTKKYHVQNHSEEAIISVHKTKESAETTPATPAPAAE